MRSRSALVRAAAHANGCPSNGPARLTPPARPAALRNTRRWIPLGSFMSTLLHRNCALRLGASSIQQSVSCPLRAETLERVVDVALAVRGEDREAVEPHHALQQVIDFEVGAAPYYTLLHATYRPPPLPQSKNSTWTRYDAAGTTGALK